MFETNPMTRLGAALTLSALLCSSIACDDGGGSGEGGGTGGAGGGAPQVGSSLRLLNAPASAQVATVPWIDGQKGAVTVEVVDGNGGRLVGLDAGTVQVELVTGSGAFGGTTSAAVQAGVASFHNLTYGTAESIEFRFVDPSDTIAPTDTLTVTLSEPSGSLAVVDGPAATQVSGVPWRSPTAGALTVEVRTTEGARDTANQTAQVTALLVTGTGQLGGTVTEAAVDGLVTFDDLRFQGAGEVVVRFIDADSMLAPTSNVTVEIDPGELAVFDAPAAVQTVRLPLRTATDGPVTVEVRDVNGTRVEADNETQVEATLLTGTGAFLGTIVRTAVNGLATFDDLAYDKVEAISFRFEDVAGVRAPSSNGACTLGGSLAFVDTPDDVQGIARPFSSGLDGPIAIEILDAAGQRLADDSSTQVAVELASGTGNLGGTTIRMATNGVVVFDDLTYDVAEVIDLRFVEVAQGRPPLVAEGIAVESISRVAYRGASPNEPQTYAVWLVEILGATALPPVRLSPPIEVGRDVYSLGASPDGRWVYYRADQDVLDVTELYAVDLHAGAPFEAHQVHTNLTAVGADVKSAFISPDSQRLVYVARPNASAPYELYMSDLGGSTPSSPTKISVSPLPTGTQVKASRVTFSADGLTLAYALADTGLATGVRQLRVVDFHGASVKEARADDALSFCGEVVHLSPDGSKLVWAGDGDTEGDQEAYVTTLAAEPHTVARLNDPLCTGCNISTVFLSPSGTVAGYAGDVRTDEDGEVVVVDVSGAVPGAPLALELSPGTTSYVQSDSLRFSPDGSRLLFIGLGAIPERRIFTADLTDLASATLTVANGTQSNFPSDGIEEALFSPDGDNVLFRADFGPGTSVVDAYVSDLTVGPGHQRINQNLDPVNGDVWSLEVSPDGGLVAYRADALVDGKVELWVVDVSGASPTVPQRVNGELMGLNPSVGLLFEFLPDGRRMLYRASESVLQTELRLVSFVDPTNAATFVRTTIGLGASLEIVIE